MDLGKAYIEAEEERKKLLQEKQKIDRRLMAVEQILEGLKFLGNPEANLPLPENLSELGLQEAVRTIFRRGYPVALAPTQVRDTLMSAGILAGTPKNLLIAIHTTISRIQGELDEVPQANGRMAYRWKPKPEKSDVFEIVPGESLDNFDKE
jgi:hypothetical protein